MINLMLLQLFIATGKMFFVHYYTVNFNDSNTDGPFTKADWNSFFSPQEILQIVQENKYLGIF